MGKSISVLEAMDVRFYRFDENGSIPLDGLISWNNLAGYQDQKREMEDSIQTPKMYDHATPGTQSQI